MNSKAADVLRGAALRGVRQITRAYHDSTGGRCAVGVLIEASGGSDALHRNHNAWTPEMECFYGITDDEAELIFIANDLDGRDFLDIANKFHDPLADVEAT